MPRIARVEAYILSGALDYVAGVGLNPVGPSPSDRPLNRPNPLALCVYPSRAQTCLVRVVAEDGTVGWGEAHAPLGPQVTRTVITEVLAPLLVGHAALAIEYHWERMYGSMRLRGHIAGYRLEAIAGVDIALWDLAGKVLGQPIYRLLGGPFQTMLPVYASGVPGSTVAERVAAARALAAAGFTAIKASIGRGDLDSDLEGIAALATALQGQADLLVDAHGVYSLDQAVRVGRRLEALGVGWLEDPLPPEDLAGYAHLCRTLDLPVAVGETDCTRWQVHVRLAQGAAAILLPDVCRAGGITEGRRLATSASLYNVRWAAHVRMGSPVHLAAAASPNFLMLEYPTAPNPIGDGLLTAPWRPVAGRLPLPEGPGLGLTWATERLRAHLWPALAEVEKER